MAESTGDEYERFEADRLALGSIGRELFDQETRIDVRLSEGLARVAVAAWGRDEIGGLDNESPSQERARTAAATLALIGLAVSERGVVGGDGMVEVSLDAWEIGEAFRTADGLGLLAKGTSSDA